MAIRFACPSCRQPIEIDDQWAGQSVGCPYCKRVVTAPTTSTWPPGDIPQASPAGQAFQPPPPPPGIGYVTQTITKSRSNSAGRALVLAIICAGLCLVGWLILMGTLASLAMEKAGKDATPEQINHAIMNILTSGQAPTNPLVTAAAFIGVICGLAGLLLAVRSLLSQEARKGMAVAACIISACFICCQFIIIMTNLGANLAVTTQPAATQTIPIEE